MEASQLRLPEPSTAQAKRARSEMEAAHSFSILGELALGNEDGTRRKRRRTVSPMKVPDAFRRRSPERCTVALDLEMKDPAGQLRTIEEGQDESTDTQDHDMQSVDAAEANMQRSGSAPS
eukprot:gnl/TRDRNA2_/TRDRNA2_195131_c0_seq1.p1 gnl/TRDRNA2_/TRDRNA2_195131_c0~~gnl/TRDRNA2_/TRDRNA2_195131_c0_seq1.p1  ORF type:complete len:120 (+),score=14.05 gnl/TRDRNA2_/TRDRNA2_195131_c0_seq1:184-543(+)